MEEEIRSINEFREMNEPVVLALRESLPFIKSFNFPSYINRGLSNIAVIMNNKLMELTNIFHSLNLGFFNDSIVARAIINHLNDYYFVGLESLKRFLEEITRFGTEDSFYLAGLLNVYKENCESIFNYNYTERLNEILVSRFFGCDLDLNLIKELFENYDEIMEQLQNELNVIGCPDVYKDCEERLSYLVHTYKYEDIVETVEQEIIAESHK